MRINKNLKLKNFEDQLFSLTNTNDKNENKIETLIEKLKLIEEENQSLRTIIRSYERKKINLN